MSFARVAREAPIPTAPSQPRAKTVAAAEFLGKCTNDRAGEYAVPAAALALKVTGRLCRSKWTQKIGVCVASANVNVPTVPVPEVGTNDSPPAASARQTRVGPLRTVID